MGDTDAFRSIPPDVIARNAKNREEKAAAVVFEAWHAPLSQYPLESMGVDTVGLMLYAAAAPFQRPARPDSSAQAASPTSEEASLPERVRRAGARPLVLEVTASCSGLKPITQLIPEHEADKLRQQFQFRSARPTDTDTGPQTAKTPLFAAATGGHPDVVQYLLSQGASPNAVCKIGRASEEREIALHEAARAGHLRVCQILVDSGSSIDFPTRGGKTPLLLAVGEGHLDVAEFLLASNANPNHSDNNGNSALHLAARQGNAEMVSLLLRFEAIKSLTDSRGRTPLQRARDTPGNDAVVPLLSMGENL